MSDEEFMQLVDAAVAALPENVKSLMDNVVVVLEGDMTSEQKIDAGFAADEVVFGLYEGIPQTERGIEYQALPDKITIFKNPILKAYSNSQDIKECVENTVWHEVAHHFGYGDPWIEGEEGRRGKEK